jgi:flagellar protein FliO/FliZ
MSLSLTLLATVAAALGPDAPALKDAHAELRDGTLTVEVTTAGSVSATDVRVKPHDRSLAFYLDGVRVRGDRLALGSASQPVVARYRPTYAKLEIPLPEGHGCTTPRSVNAGVGWVRAVIPCAADRPAPARQPARAPAAAVEKAAPAPAEPAPEPAAKTPAPPPAPARAAVPPPSPAPPPAATPPAPAPAPAARPVGASPGGTGWIVLLLAGVAGAAFWLWKRRGSPLLRQIQILETASLGPKRSLILAEVNGVTMVIGASEAGLTLLSPAARPTGEPSEPRRTEPEPENAQRREAGPFAEEDEERLPAAIPLRPGANGVHSDSATGDPEEDAAFAAMLIETIEDQELLHRLSGSLPEKSS